MADPADLPDVEILGHRLGPSIGLDPGRPVYRLWHQVEIRREGEAETVTVDGQTVPARGTPPRLATWLTIRPCPGRMVRIRDLDLRW